MIVTTERILLGGSEEYPSHSQQHFKVTSKKKEEPRSFSFPRLLTEILFFEKIHQKLIKSFRFETSRKLIRKKEVFHTRFNWSEGFP